MVLHTEINVPVKCVVFTPGLACVRRAKIECRIVACTVFGRAFLELCQVDAIKEHGGADAQHDVDHIAWCRHSDHGVPTMCQAVPLRLCQLVKYLNFGAIVYEQDMSVH